MKEQKGITLVALVITIIILLILATISLGTLSQSGLFGKAKEAENASINAQGVQNNTLNEFENAIDQYLDNLTPAK